MKELLGQKRKSAGEVGKDVQESHPEMLFGELLGVTTLEKYEACLGELGRAFKYTNATGNLLPVGRNLDCIQHSIVVLVVIRLQWPNTGSALVQPAQVLGS